ncbi:MAG: S26 family signal peptidase [Ignavibacteriales bacterium]|nr:S26 family signal peptidase [Ignavibacteriales bacterium]
MKISDRIFYGRLFFVIAVVFLQIISVRLFIISTYKITTNSMEATLEPGDFIVVQNLDIPDRNLFISPYRPLPPLHNLGWLSQTGKKFGDRLQISRGKKG